MSDEPHDAEAGQHPNFRVTRAGGEIGLAFAFDPRWVAALKRMRRRHFEAETKTWYVPEGLAPELVTAFEAAGMPPEMFAALRPIAQEMFALSALSGVRALKAYEDAVPALVERYPGLFAHQYTGIEFLLRPRTCRGALLADDMGLGKTRQAIIAAHEAAVTGSILVVCPASVKLHWQREIHHTLRGQRVVVVGSEPFEIARWTIINYDMLKSHHAQLLTERWSCLVLDEAHYIKNRQSQRSKLLMGGERRPYAAAPRMVPGERIRGIAERAERIFLLTGTPVTNRPLDLFSLLRALDHPLGDDLLAFAQRYCAAFQTPFGWDMKGASNLDELHEKLADVFLRRRKDELLDLPPKLRTYMPVEVDLVAYRKIWTDHVARLTKSQRVPKRTLLAEIAKLRHAAALAKIPAAKSLVDNIRASGEKVIVFSGHLGVIRALTAHLGRHAVKVTGRESAVARQKAVDQFQDDPEVEVFLGILQAAGVGISLTAATQVVFVDYSWVPGDHLQAEDRAYRVGQKNAVTVTYLSAKETIDEHVERLLASKLGVIAEAVEGHEALPHESFLDQLLEIVARPPEAS